MITIIVVGLICFAAIVIVAVKESQKNSVDKIDENLIEPVSKECGCGKTNDKDGKCDGSHLNDT